MTPAELVQFQQTVADKHRALVAIVEGLDTARDDVESVDHQADAMAEALFLRAFTTYEAHIENLFFHYVIGGISLQGRAAVTFLAPITEENARKIVKRGSKFLSWAKPSSTTDTARLFMENGWPVVDMIATKSQELADCERIRNRIAHLSIESASEFNVVQRNLFQTERLFSISPGQLLRVRHTRHRISHLRRFVNVMNETVEAIIDPPL
ncbi:MAG: hypothetical protein CTR54_03620 [Rhizobium sp.]|nr:MAG: hypothetical protein CTR54_03620 [Rhizobium sp.]